MTTGPISRTFTALALASILLAACAGEPTATLPTSTLGAPNDLSLGKAKLSDKAAEGKSNSGKAKSHTPTFCGSHAQFVGSGVFGPAGGTLVFGDSRLVIPSGALADTVTISATELAGNAVQVELQPHGLIFATPATLLLDASGCSITPNAAPPLVYLGTGGEVLETINTVFYPQWSLLAAPINHFSGYAIAF